MASAEEIPSPRTTFWGKFAVRLRHRTTPYVLAAGAIVVATWFGIQVFNASSATKGANVAAANLAKRNVLLTGTPPDSANLTNRAMDEQFIRDLSMLVHLKTLNLKGTGTTDEQLAPILSNLDLISLVLNATPVGDAGMDSVRTQGRLETLMLADTDVGDEGLAAIGRMRSLTELNLSRTKITDHGLIEIARLPNLVRLILDGTAITDEGLIHLATLPKLVVLEARETNLTADGLREFRKWKRAVTIKR